MAVCKFLITFNIRISDYICKIAIRCTGHGNVTGDFPCTCCASYTARGKNFVLWTTFLRVQWQEYLSTFLKIANIMKATTRNINAMLKFHYAMLKHIATMLRNKSGTPRRRNVSPGPVEGISFLFLTALLFLAPVCDRSLPGHIRQTHDVSGRHIVPGIINAHGHVGIARGLETGEAVRTAENIRSQLVLYARYGVTSVISLEDIRNLRSINAVFIGGKLVER